MSSNNPYSYQHGMINSRQNGLGWPPRGNSNNIIHNRISAGAYSNNLHPHDMRPMMNYSQMGYRGPSMGNNYRFYNFPPRGMGPRTLTHFGSIGQGRSRSSPWYQKSTISNRGVPIIRHPIPNSGSRQQITPWPSLIGSQSTLRLETDDNKTDEDEGDNDAKFSSEEEAESQDELGPNSSTGSMQNITSQPKLSGSQSTKSFSSGTADMITPHEMRSQVQEKSLDNILLEMFKYYEKAFPKEFIQCLKMRCTQTSCNMCSVSFLSRDTKTKEQLIVAHYKGKRHSQSLRKHFQHWKNNRSQYIDNFLDLFKYYEKIYPEEFIYYLKLRCTSTSCNLCTVSFTGLVYGFGSSITSQNMVHYTGKRHVQTLRKYFINWKKSKQAQRPAKAKHIERTSPGSSLFTRLCTSGSGLNNRYNLICTKCAQRGHKKENCPHNVICGKCGLSGHSKKFCMAFGEDSDDDEIELIVPPPKPDPQVVDLEADEMPPIIREETGPDEMPTFEIDSAYIEDRIKQEIQIEVPVPDKIMDLKREDSSTESANNTDPAEMPTFEMDSAYIEDRIKQEIQIEVPDNIVDFKKEDKLVL